MSPPDAASAIVGRLAAPMLELRFLLERGYRRSHALSVVSEHHQLPLADRNVLERSIFPEAEARARATRLVGRTALRGARVVLDGYNVIIGVECLLAGEPVFRCDDGLHRDVARLGGRYRQGPRTAAALERVAGLLAREGVASALVILDAQVSRSGELAEACRAALLAAGLEADAETDRHVDRRLRAEADDAVVCSSDRAVVDRCARVFDVVGALAEAGAVASPPPASDLWGAPSGG